MNDGNFLGRLAVKAKDFFQVKSGGKTIVAVQRFVRPGAIAILLFAGAMSWLGPKEDRTYYRQTSGSPKREASNGSAIRPPVSMMAGLFGQGKRALEEKQRRETEQQRKKVAIRYFAPQVLGGNTKGPKAIKSGSKLIGFLVNPLDTRALRPVRVVLPHGGESGGVSIDQGSILVGQFSYSGDSDRVFLSFLRLDSPTGEPMKVAALALDANDFTPGVKGEVFTGNGVKLAASLGLTMFSGMTDVLTERESLGSGASSNAVQAKASMRNALLQGLSQASKDQASRTASQIDSEKAYVIVPQGKEMIIELTQDFRK